MGFLDGPDVPDFKVPDSVTDSKSMNFLDTTLNRGDKTTQSAYDRGTEAAQGARGLIPTTQNMQREETALGGGPNEAQLNAINMKGQNLFSQNVQQMMTKNKLQEYTARSNQLGSDFNLSQKQNQIFETIRQAKLQEEQAKTASRNAVIGNVLGAIGAVVGTIYSSGNVAVGAAVGMGVKSAVGGGSETGGGGNPHSALAGLSSSGPRSAHNEAGNGMGDFNDRMYS